MDENRISDIIENVFNKVPEPNPSNIENKKEAKR